MSYKSIIGLIFALTITSCSKNSSLEPASEGVSSAEVSRSAVGFGGYSEGSQGFAKSMSADSMSERASPSAPESDSSQVQDIGRKVIKNGSLTLQVHSLSEQSEALNYVKTLAQKYTVTFDREDESKWGNRSTVSLTARVPAEHFDTYINSITTGPFKVVSKSINVSEVTDQYIDLEVRLENKKELRAKYLSVLKSATVVKDIIAINKSIEQVTSEIESAEGQFKYLKKQISYSTLNIEISAELPLSLKDQNSFLFEVWKSVQRGLQGIKHFTLDIIALWPFFILFGIGVVVFIKWRRKRNED